MRGNCWHEAQHTACPATESAYDTVELTSQASCALEGYMMFSQAEHVTKHKHTHSGSCANDELVISDVFTTLGQLQALAFDVHRLNLGLCQVLNACRQAV